VQEPDTRPRLLRHSFPRRTSGAFMSLSDDNLLIQNFELFGGV
jgi:hypothetical protein